MYLIFLTIAYNYFDFDFLLFFCNYHFCSIYSHGNYACTCYNYIIYTVVLLLFLLLEVIV